MQVVSKLTDISSPCSQMAVGDTETFSVSGEVSQEEASQLAGEINAERTGHVWLTADEAIDGVTRIHVRCTE